MGLFRENIAHTTVCCNSKHDGEKLGDALECLFRAQAPNTCLKNGLCFNRFRCYSVRMGPTTETRPPYGIAGVQSSTIVHMGMSDGLTFGCRALKAVQEGFSEPRLLSSLCLLRATTIARGDHGRELADGQASDLGGS